MYAHHDLTTISFSSMIKGAHEKRSFGEITSSTVHTLDMRRDCPLTKFGQQKAKDPPF